MLDILLTTNDIDLLVETNKLFFSHFDMKDLGEAFYVLGLQILRDRLRGILRLSQHMYIELIMKKVHYAIMFFWLDTNCKG